MQYLDPNALTSWTRTDMKTIRVMQSVVIMSGIIIMGLCVGPAFTAVRTIMKLDGNYHHTWQNVFVPMYISFGLSLIFGVVPIMLTVLMAVRSAVFHSDQNIPPTIIVCLTLINLILSAFAAGLGVIFIIPISKVVSYVDGENVDGGTISSWLLLWAILLIAIGGTLLFRFVFFKRKSDSTDQAVHTPTIIPLAVGIGLVLVYQNIGSKISHKTGETWTESLRLLYICIAIGICLQVFASIAVVVFSLVAFIHGKQRALNEFLLSLVLPLSTFCTTAFVFMAGKRADGADVSGWAVGGFLVPEILCVFLCGVIIVVIGIRMSAIRAGVMNANDITTSVTTVEIMVSIDDGTHAAVGRVLADPDLV